MRKRLEVFLGSFYGHYLRYRSIAVLSGSARLTDLPIIPIPTPFNEVFRHLADLSPLRHPITHMRQYGNINPLSIDYAFRPRLRSRLTLIRLALIRKP